MNETKKPWCYYCRTDSHRDALCWSTRPKHWIPGPEDYEARIATLEKRLAEAGWQPIETLQKGTRKMFVAIAFNVDTGLSAPGGGYRNTTDPWCVWYSDGEFVRWPHPFPPTHWMPLPPPPQENTND